MIELAFGSTLAGFAIFLWGLRSLRSRMVRAGGLRMRGRWSAWVFGFVSTICGFLMMLTGPAALLSLDMALAEAMAKSGLFMFAIAWILAFVFECLYRISWHLFPAHAPRELRDASNRSHRARRKQKLQHEDDGPTRAGIVASVSKLSKTASNLFLSNGSQLFSRIMTPLRSWDKQNLWHANGEAEENYSDKSQTIADADHLDLLRDSNSTDRKLETRKARDID